MFAVIFMCVFVKYVQQNTYVLCSEFKVENINSGVKFWGKCLW